jgi:hypothetical protein
VLAAALDRYRDGRMGRPTEMCSSPLFAPAVGRASALDCSHALDESDHGEEDVDQRGSDEQTSHVPEDSAVLDRPMSWVYRYPSRPPPGEGEGRRGRDDGSAGSR